jgi:hypothetical protein
MMRQLRRVAEAVDRQIAGVVGVVAGVA